MATADGLAAVEACSSLIGRCFASAEAVGDATGLVTPGVLEVIGRELCRRGESLHVLEADVSRLTPAGTWDVRGPDDPAGWFYRCDTFGASNHRTRLLAAGAVVHCRVTLIQSARG